MIQEVEFPLMARKPGQVSQRAFQIVHGATCLGVLYAHEPAAKDGSLLIHVSISKSTEGLPRKVIQWDIEEVQQVIAKRLLAWPAEYECVAFEAGPFKRLGIHVWQLEPAA